MSNSYPAACDSILVSIVIPVYNRPVLVTRCIESCIAQSMGASNFEIVVVDDRSTDNTFEILTNLQDRYQGRLRVFRLAKNSGGASGPRNFGISVATGKYIFFVDSDDTLDPHTLEDAYALTDGGSADLVLVRTDKWSRASLLSGNSDSVHIYSRQDWVESFVTANHLFKRSKLIDLNLRFNENIMGQEDNVFLLAFMFRQYDLKWSILQGRKYYLSDTSRSSSDAGVVSRRRTNGLVRHKVASTFGMVAEDVRLADKLDIVTSYLPGIRGDEPSRFLSLPLPKLRELRAAFEELVPEEVEHRMSPWVSEVVRGIRSGTSEGIIKSVHRIYTEKQFLPSASNLKFARSLKDWRDTSLIVISVKNSPGAIRQSGLIYDALMELGLCSTLEGKADCSFLCVIHKGQILIEEYSERSSIEFEENLDGIHLNVRSAGKCAGGASSIKINGSEVSQAVNGFNIAIYSTVFDKIIDSVGLDAFRRFRLVRSENVSAVE